MAITDEQRRAICRVYVPGPARRGTGFLVNARFVLTAAHVVASATDSKVQYGAGDIELTFGNPGGTPVFVQGAKVVKFDAEKDWALLELQLPQGVPIAATPLRGHPMPASYQSPWQTYGYSDAAEIAGQEYGGTIRTQNAERFQLLTDQAQGSPAGLSGSPCLVDGEVVGIVLETRDPGSSETLYARSVEVVAQRGCTEITLAPSDLPYVADVEYTIQGFTPLLPLTAVKLGLAKSEADAKASIPKESLPRRIAEAMMCGVDPSLAAIKNLKRAFASHQAPQGDPPKDAQEIINWVTRTWIDARAVRRLWETLSRGDKLVVLNIHDPQIAPWYIHRAGCFSAAAPGDFAKASVVDAPTVQRDVLKDELERTLALLLDQALEDLPEYLSNVHSHDLEPIVLWLTAVPSRADLDYVRALHPGYGKLRILFVTGPAPPPIIAAEYADAEQISPTPLPERVALALKDYGRARSLLHSLFKQPAPGPS